MDKVFICSPYRSDVEKNKEIARKLGRLALEKGLEPVIPHLYWTQLLDDNIKEERHKGIQLGHNWLEECCVLWIYVQRYNFGNISTGMMSDISYWDAMTGGGWQGGDITLINERFEEKVIVKNSEGLDEWDKIAHDLGIRRKP